MGDEILVASKLASPGPEEASNAQRVACWL